MKRAKDNDKTVSSSPGELREGLGSVGSVFTLTYGIVFVISMSYNIGYFKELNPQIVDLMTLGDYIDDTVHNIWLLLLAALMFFGSSLAVIKQSLTGKFDKLVTTAFCSFLLAIYCFGRGISYSKFWPTITALSAKPGLIVLFVVVIGTGLILITFLIYRLSSQLVKDEMTFYTLGCMPIVIFLFIVLTPYLGGMIEGHIENHYIAVADQKPHAVDITMLPQENMLYNLYIIKKLEKGLIIKELNNSITESGFILSFIPWGIVKRIDYHNVVQAIKE